MSEIAAITKPITFSNYRVEYLPGHDTHESICYIVADDAEFGGDTVRVFDVPDPDKSQRAVAELACRAMNAREALVEALELFVGIYPPNARKHPDVAIAIGKAEAALDLARER